MRLLALTLGLAFVLTDGCGDTIDLSPSSPESPRSIALEADSAVTALDSSLVNTLPHYRCTMGLRVRGSSTISGETAVWTGGSYRLVETASDGVDVRLTAGDLVGWFGTDRVGPGEVVATSRAFESNRRFDAVVVNVTVDLVAEGDPSRHSRALTTSFRCG